MDARERGIMENGSDQDKKNLRISDGTVQKMNRTYIDKINNTVKFNNDILFILGDFGYFKDEAAVHSMRSRICVEQVYFIIGNHDRRQWVQTPFDRVYDQLEINVDGKPITLNHYAMLRWNKSHHGSYMLFGHSHGMLGEWIGQHMPWCRLLDVGVDGHSMEGHYAPWSFKEVKEYMDKREGEKL